MLLNYARDEDRKLLELELANLSAMNRSLGDMYSREAKAFLNDPELFATVFQE